MATCRMCIHDALLIATRPVITRPIAGGHADAAGSAMFQAQTMQETFRTKRQPYRAHYSPELIAT
eukprot:360921-Chlamydomonas_euryale.AAC.5